MESYTVTLSTTPVISGTGSAENGGNNVVVSENNLMDVAKSIIAKLEFPNATLSAKVQTTTATSPSGTQTSFIKSTSSNAVGYDMNENIKFDVPQMICSEINETNELSGVKSFEMPITLSSSNSNLSPVIDLTRCSWVSVQNILDNIDSSSDVYPTTDFVASTEPEGDNNVAIYITRKASLAQSATALKVFFSANRDTDSEILVMYKILRSDDASDFDELGWRFFNDTASTPGLPDTTTNPSLGRDDFQEYLYTAGVTDDGIGDALDPFISFSIKIVMQSTNSAEPPRLKDFRAMALAT
jgi:hypothetical protein